MRTTVNLDDDVAVAIERLRRERSIGLSQAINELIRAGLTAKRPREPFHQRSQHMGIRMDVTNVAEVLDLLEGPTHR
jgi:metal-responsive CopG/Arc/MetJ family transcriptional regulator